MQMNAFRFFWGCAWVTSILLIVNESVFSQKETEIATVKFPHQWIGDIDRINFKEPSGIVFHPTRGTLFVVGDGGDICEIKTDGTPVKQKRIRRADFEGITCDPATGLLYIAVEGEEMIIELHPEDFSILRTFSIERTFRGKVRLKPGGQGIEAITFVPDVNHREGGTFFVANQSFTLTDQEDPSAIFEILVPLKSDSGRNPGAKIVRYFSIGVIDLSGLVYDSNSDQLYVISDATDTFLEITKQGKILKSYALPGKDQEGIAIDNKDFLYIAQDSGGIIKCKWNR